MNEKKVVYDGNGVKWYITSEMEDPFNEGHGQMIYLLENNEGDYKIVNQEYETLIDHAFNGFDDYFAANDPDYC